MPEETRKKRPIDNRSAILYEPDLLKRFSDANLPTGIVVNFRYVLLSTFRFLSSHQLLAWFFVDHGVGPEYLSCRIHPQLLIDALGEDRFRTLFESSEHDARRSLYVTQPFRVSIAATFMEEEHNRLSFCAERLALEPGQGILRYWQAGDTTGDQTSENHRFHLDPVLLPFIARINDCLKQASKRTGDQGRLVAIERLRQGLGNLPQRPQGCDIEFVLRSMSTKGYCAIPVITLTDEWFRLALRSEDKVLESCAEEFTVYCCNQEGSGSDVAADVFALLSAVENFIRRLESGIDDFILEIVVRDRSDEKIGKSEQWYEALTKTPASDAQAA